MARIGRRCRPDIGRNEAGFTLVEVMSALAILALAITAVFATFITQQRSFTVQNRVVEMQQNIRQASEFMTRDVRVAGYGIPASVNIPDNAVAAGVTTFRSLYAKDGGTTNTDEIFVLYLYDMDANLPPTTITAGMPTPSANFKVASTTGFSDGDLVIITNGTSADLFQATEVTEASLDIQHNPGGSSRDYNAPGGHSTFPGYDSGSTLAKARFVRYYIDSATDPAHPTLMLDMMNGDAPQPLADDIEDMQFTYGLDTNADGVVDTWSVSPADTSQIRQVQMELLARTPIPDAKWSETRPALGNRTGGGTQDGYRRRVMAVVIDVRNSGV